MNWKFCHELAHILLGHLDEAIHTPEQERMADELAGELLLPEAEFKPLALREGLDELKRRFPQASWEAIARRRLAFRPAVMTVFDAGRLTSRQAPENYAFPATLTEAERETARRCLEEKCYQRYAARGMLLEAWHIDDGRGVERVILLTEAD